MENRELHALAAGLDGIRTDKSGHLTAWRYHGRVVAREVDSRHLALRTAFAARDALVEQDPVTFSVPTRFISHQMVMADIADGDPQAIRDAFVAAWDLQRKSG